jgi:redox-sensitive bicupin YhaK (pirin superfamily)
VVLDAGAELMLALDADFEYAVLAVSGAPQVDGAAVPAGTLLHMGCGRGHVAVATEEPSRLMLLGGTPFDEELVMWWNFVGRDHDEIAAARGDWSRGDARFGEVRGYPRERLPAPPLPGTRLLPRSRRRS